MKNKLLTLIIILICNSIIAGTFSNKTVKSSLMLQPLIINTNDTVVFDLSHAVYTANYVDIPVLLISDDLINALDFSLKFNELNLTYDSIINYKSYLSQYANFNNADRFLRFASYSSHDFDHNSSLVAIRFLFTNPCGVISKSDFNSITAYLNGDPCAFKFSEVPAHGLIAGFTSTKLCTGTNEIFNGISTLTSGTVTNWSWDFGNGNTANSQNPSTTFSSNGNYTVTLIATSNEGCLDTISKTLIVNNSPTVNFSSILNCTNSTITFTNNSSIASGSITDWHWDFGDTDSSLVLNPIHTYASGGNYLVTLNSISDSGCVATYSNYVAVTSPTANFIATNGCTGATINFNSSSTVSSGTITSWKWYYGDGNSSILQNDSHSYSSAGPYIVSLKVTTNLNCADSISKIITIEDKPIVNFSGDVLSGCMPLKTVFTDSSITAAGSVYSWNFGDYTTSILKDVTHDFITAGVYNITHYVTTTAGCSDSLVKTGYVIVNSQPVAKFNTVNGCTGAVINFLDSSIVSSGATNSWKWYFGDGTISTIQNPSHIYALPGTYTVSFKIITNQNCSDSISKIITIQDKPIINFSGNILSGCFPLNVSFSDSSNTSLGSTYSWSFGDNTFASTKNCSHTFNTSGAFTVTHYVTTSAGCSDSLVKPSYINVNTAPIANFNAINGCVGASLNFTDSSTIPPGSIANWKWYFGDGNISTLQNPSHSYALEGTYVVSLKVTSNQSCYDSIIRTIIIQNKPIVKFVGDILGGCSPLLVSFNDSSITASGSSYSWSFGDNTTSTSVNPIHTFLSTGIYTVTHYVTTSAGCTDSLVKPSYIIVNTSPVANFGVGNRCLGAPTVFTDSSTVSSGTISNWKWNFGDGNSSSQHNPSYIYANPGTYLVSLVVKNNQNCSDSIAKTIVIENKPIVKFGATILSGCKPLNVLFIDSSSTLATSNYSWNFGDAGISFSQNSSHIYLNSGIYTVKHYVITDAGCSDSLIKKAYITVGENPTALFIATPDKVKLTNAVVSFSNHSTNYTNSLWAFGDSTLSINENPTHTYFNIGNYYACITVGNLIGCQANYCDTITVTNSDIVAVPKAFTPNNDGSNDKLKVRGGPMIEMEFKIFNEWGNQVFFSTSQSEGWDGTLNGVDQPVGVYEYSVKGKTIDNESIKMHGVVTLVR